MAVAEYKATSLSILCADPHSNSDVPENQTEMFLRDWPVQGRLSINDQGRIEGTIHLKELFGGLNSHIEAAARRFVIALENCGLQETDLCIGEKGCMTFCSMGISLNPDQYQWENSEQDERIVYGGETEESKMLFIIGVTPMPQE